MIRLQLIGRIGQDATVKKLDSGKQVINFSLAHTEKRGDKDHTIWIDAAIWRKEGVSVKVADFLKKGQLVYVEGEPSVRAWANKEGIASAVQCLTVTDVQLLEKRAEVTADDLPY